MAGKLDAMPHVSAEKLYQVEHPRLVSQFDDVVSLEGDEHGYYISKAWLKGKRCVVSSKIPVPNTDRGCRLAARTTQDARGGRE